MFRWCVSERGKRVRERDFLLLRRSFALLRQKQEKKEEGARSWFFGFYGLEFRLETVDAV